MGVSHKANWGYKYTITAADQSAGYVQIDFSSSYDLAYNILCLASNGAVIALTGAVITNPSTGVLKITSGGSFTVTAGYVLEITAHANSADYS